MVIQDNTEKMLTVGEVAELIHIHPNTLRRWCEQGKIASYRITSRGDRRFKKSDIDLFLSKFNPYKTQANNGDAIISHQTFDLRI
jgi:excisionase family DNA binding protein